MAKAHACPFSTNRYSGKLCRTLVAILLADLSGVLTDPDCRNQGVAGLLEESATREL